MQQPNYPMKERNLEKMSKNAQKMRELEARMDDIETRIENIKVINSKNRIDDKASQKDIDDLYQQISQITMELEKSLKTKVNEKFIETFDDMGKQVYESDLKVQRLKDKKYELTTLLSEMQNIEMQEDERDEKLNEEFEELKSEYEYINKNYDHISKENLSLGKELDEKNNAINLLLSKLQELKDIMGKLTEVKVMLNKYFSSHFQNFSQKEKDLIESVKKYRIVDDFKYMAAMEQ